MDQNFSRLQMYEILEPKKAPIDPHRDVGILIDIHDDQDKQTQLNLSGSELDNIKKAEFDLVDLYQNIYVTPQHLRKPLKVTEMSHIDYSAFFEKLEAGETIDSIKSPNTLQNSPLNAIGTDEIGIISNEIEKKMENETTSSNNNILKNYNITRVLKVPKVNEIAHENHHGIQKKNESSTRCIIKNKLDNDNVETFHCAMQNTNNFIISNSISKTIENDLKTSSGIDFSSDSFNNCLTAVLGKPSVNINPNTTFNSFQSHIPNQIILQNVGAANFYNNNQPRINIGTLKTVTLDKKTYAKQRQVKSKMEKLGYTKGPDLYEKSVVLPQMMKRLAERKKVLQEEAKYTRRLIVNLGKHNSECHCQSQNRTPGKLINKTNINFTDQALIHAKISEQGPSPQRLNSQNDVLKPNLVIAMEDCNRERLIAYRVKSAFQKYVQTGSYY